MVLVLVAAAPAALMLLLLRPLPALFATCVWLAAAYALAAPLLGVAARALRPRRENLALIAQGK
jgi:hypothetical protein